MKQEANVSFEEENVTVASETPRRKIHKNQEKTIIFERLCL